MFSQMAPLMNGNMGAGAEMMMRGADMAVSVVGWEVSSAP